jgi:CRISPR-associated protein Cmr2
MNCFDLLADEDLKFAPTERGWLLAASLARKHIKSTQELTEARGQFLQQHGIVNPDKNRQGAAKRLPCQTIPLELDTARRDKDVLRCFPRYSARLLLEFTLCTPLLSQDDDPFYLFDNPVRKDHIFGMPYLSAAAVKGLSVDAYQRAFPSMMGVELDKNRKAIERLRGYRAQDSHSLRLFGIDDDGGHRDTCYTGRLHFSPIWFKEVQFLVMNQKDDETAIGTLPIQFEVMAPNQKSILEVIYFNPYGVPHSDETTVREDLARWLAAVAVWWRNLGLGAKRLAGYGAIDFEKVTLQAVDWSGMPALPSPQSQSIAKTKSSIPSPPSYYEEYLDAEGLPLREDAFVAKLAVELAKKEAEMVELDQQWRRAQGKAKSKADKELKKAVITRDNLAKQQRSHYTKVLEYFKEYGQFTTAKASATLLPLVEEKWPIYERREEGADSWLKLAQWIVE